jgi:hypothetical protein
MMLSGWLTYCVGTKAAVLFHSCFIQGLTEGSLGEMVRGFDANQLSGPYTQVRSFPPMYGTPVSSPRPRPITVYGGFLSHYTTSDLAL